MLTVNDSKDRCPDCPTGAPMWMTTFADMATLLMAFFVLLVAFAEKDTGGSSRQVDFEERGAGLQDKIRRIEVLGGKADSLSIVPLITKQGIDNVRVLSEEKAKVSGNDNETISTLTGSKDFAVNGDVEAIRQALAAEITAGKVKLEVKPEQVIVKVATYDTQSFIATGRRLGNSQEISDEDMLVYAKIAKAQNITSTDIIVKKVRAKLFSTEKVDMATTKADENQYDRLLRRLSGPISEGTVLVLREGRTVLIRIAGSDSFASGQATISNVFRPLLSQIAYALVGARGKLVIEGHTDSIPLAFNEIYRSNWDLSSARAAAVAQYFVANPDLENLSFMVSGLADIEPVASNTSVSGRALNRRIEIILDDD